VIVPDVAIPHNKGTNGIINHKKDNIKDIISLISSDDYLGMLSLLRQNAKPQFAFNLIPVVN
jgi:hypothetical protein